jgi:stage V sporulation protein S
MLENTAVGNNGCLNETSRIEKIASPSRSTALTDAIVWVMRQRRPAEIQATGTGAVNKVVKALAIARNYLKDEGIDFVYTPEFIDLDVNGDERTTVRFSLEAYSPRDSL